MQDRDLVAAIVAGDPAGLAAAYDRYASPLYAYCRTMLRDPEDAADALQDTFVVAAQKLDGLRDPDRLRPWLYAVARNECLRRVRGRQAQAMVDLDQAGEVSDDGIDVDAGLREADVRSLIWAAIQGLNPSEREVFELSVRHELEGADLAAALGVSPNHAHALLSRARGQLEKSLGALLVARTGRQDCPELAAILTGWDGELTALLRKRLNRHIEQCEECAGRKHRELRPEALLGALPILLLPPGLRSSTLRLVGNVLPGGPPPGNPPPSGASTGNTGASNSSGTPGTSGDSSSSHSPSGQSSSSGGASSGGTGASSGMAGMASIGGLGGLRSLGAGGSITAEEYCAHVARRAEPFDRAGFPVPLDHRRRPLADARRRSLVAALLLLLLLLGLGGYTAMRLISPDSAAAALPTQSPSTAAAIVDTPSSVVIQISTSSPSPSPSNSPSPSQSPSPSPSASPSLSPSPSIIITLMPTSASPSRSPSPSPPPPPPPGVLVVISPKVAPYTVRGTPVYNANGGIADYAGEVVITAKGGTVANYNIVVPTPRRGLPFAVPAAGGPLQAGASVTITLGTQTTLSQAPIVFTIEPGNIQIFFYAPLD